MKKFSVFVFCAALFAAPAVAQQVQWAKALPLPANSEVSALATDQAGHLYAATLIGQQQPERFGGLYAVGDVQLIKYDSLGNTLWTREFSGQGRVFDLTVDAGNHLVMCGIFLSGLEFDTDSVTNFPVPFPRFGSFLTRLDSAGTVQWLNHAVLPDMDMSMVSVATDSESNTYVTGISQDIDGFFAKYSAAGTQLWSRTLPGVRTFADVAVNHLDEVLLTGTCSPGTHFDSIAPAYPPATGYFQFLLQANALGQTMQAWVKPYITFDFSSAVATTGAHRLWHYPASPNQNGLGNNLSYINPASNEIMLYQDSEVSGGHYPHTLARSSAGHLMYMHTEAPFLLAQGLLSLHRFQSGSYNPIPEFQASAQGLEGTALAAFGQATYLGGHFFQQQLQLGSHTLQNAHNPLAWEKQAFVARIGQAPLAAPDQLMHQPLQLFPNPSAGTFTVLAPDNTQPETLDILDQAGRRVHQQHWQGNATQLTVTTQLPAGFYVVRLQTKTGVATRKLVLTKP